MPTRRSIRCPIPTIRDAVARATFEHLVGFQLTQEQLRYNATR